MSMSLRDRILAERERVAANKSKGMRTYKFKSGKTKLRILPMDGDPKKDWFRTFGKTYLKSFDGKQFFGIIDRTLTYDEPTDPIRDLIFDAMRQAPDEDTKKHYQQMLARQRYVFNALILTGDPDQKPDEPVLVEVSETQMDDIFAQFLVWSEDDENYDLAAAKTGHVFEVEKTGSGLDTRYNWQATPKQMKVSDKLIEKAHDIDAWIVSQVEGMGDQAIAFMQKVNAAVGIQTTVSAGEIGASDSAKSSAKKAAANAEANVGEEAVTTEIDDDEDEAVEAEFTEVTDDEPPFETEDSKEEEGESVGTTGDDELDDILSELEG